MLTGCQALLSGVVWRSGGGGGGKKAQPEFWQRAKTSDLLTLQIPFKGDSAFCWANLIMQTQISLGDVAQKHQFNNPLSDF